MQRYLQMRTKPHADYNQLAQTVFAGGIVVYQQLPEVQHWVRLTRDRLQTQFLPGPPSRAEYHLTESKFKQDCNQVQKAFEHDAKIKQQWTQVLAALGFDLRQTYTDKLGLRIVASQEAYNGRRLSTTPVHRDSWGSNLPSQINWWLPVYPVSEKNSLVFYPDYWDKPISNTSADWSYTDFKVEQAKQGATKKVTYPTAPYATESLPNKAAHTLVIQPGDIVAFSGAHLHGGKPNTGDHSRISIETRTVVEDDVCQKRGAPNVDGAYARTHPKWFRHVQTNAFLRLPD